MNDCISKDKIGEAFLAITELSVSAGDCPSCKVAYILMLCKLHMYIKLTTSNNAAIKKFFVEYAIKYKPYESLFEEIADAATAEYTVSSFLNSPLAVRTQDYTGVRITTNPEEFKSIVLNKKEEEWIPNDL